MHVVPTPLAAPHQVRPPTQAGPTAGAAGQVHVAIADAAGLLLQAEMHMSRECSLKQSPSRCLTPQHMHQGLSRGHRVSGLLCSRSMACHRQRPQLPTARQCPSCASHAGGGAGMQPRACPTLDWPNTVGSTHQRPCTSGRDAPQPELGAPLCFQWRPVANAPVQGPPAADGLHCAEAPPARSLQHQVAGLGCLPQVRMTLCRKLLLAPVGPDRQHAGADCGCLVTAERQAALVTRQRGCCTSTPVKEWVLPIPGESTPQLRFNAGKAHQARTAAI